MVTYWSFLSKVKSLVVQNNLHLKGPYLDNKRVINVGYFESSHCWIKKDLAMSISAEVTSGPMAHLSLSLKSNKIVNMTSTDLDRDNIVF